MYKQFYFLIMRTEHNKYYNYYNSNILIFRSSSNVYIFINIMTEGKFPFYVQIVKLSLTSFYCHAE
jgi:hypothetical protein